MRCAHVQERTGRSRLLCGKETEFVCWHCHAPRCVNHAIRIDGEILCLHAVRERLGFAQEEAHRR